MPKPKNMFRFGDCVYVPGRSSSRLVVEIISDDKIKVMDLVEITPAQRADWTRTLIKGELRLVPGLIVDITDVMLWDKYIEPLQRAA
jgi:hypothetical protein